MEGVCRGAHWDELYGVKGDNKLLAGPGLASSDAAGVVLGGGIWARRLSSMCSEITGEESEEEFYAHIFRPHRPPLAAGGSIDGSTVQKKGDFLRSMCVDKAMLCTATDADAAAQYWVDSAARSHAEGKATDQSHGGQKKTKATKGTKKTKKRKRTGKKKRKRKHGKQRRQTSGVSVTDDRDEL